MHVFFGRHSKMQPAVSPGSEKQVEVSAINPPFREKSRCDGSTGRWVELSLVA
uniref:Uncharacterized protein n=2 Tax=Pan TaxID=9596 RepID=G2HF47_PANTR|nr:hypothetical protein [Pan troglodytes]